MTYINQTQQRTTKCTKTIHRQNNLKKLHTDPQIHIGTLIGKEQMTTLLTIATSEITATRMIMAGNFEPWKHSAGAQVAKFQKTKLVGQLCQFRCYDFMASSVCHIHMYDFYSFLPLLSHCQILIVKQIMFALVLA